MDNQPLVRANHVARRLNVSEGRVYELAKLGLLPCIRLGRQVRFSTADLEQFISEGGKDLAGVGLKETLEPEAVK